MQIGSQTVLEHCVANCRQSEGHINKKTAIHNIEVKTVLLVPSFETAEFIEILSGMKLTDITLIDGPEDDVLTRYLKILEHSSPKYICRITSDCPFVPPELITKHIQLAVTNRLDYVANVDVRFRTAPDGYDVEVFSRDLLIHMDEHTKNMGDREHVTSFVRRRMPRWARAAHVTHNVDMSDIKWSIDTEDDYVRLRDLYLKKQAKEVNLKNTNLGMFKF